MPRVRQSGFLLVLVLLVLVLVSTLMLSLSRGSSRRAIEARDAEVRLQRRWGEQTLSAALLPRAEELIDQLTAEEPGDGAAQSTFSLRLSGMVFDVTLSDEQAKVNVNTLVRVHEDRAVDAMRPLLPTNISRQMIDLRPDPRAYSAPPSQQPRVEEVEGDRENSDPFPRAFGGWDQVLTDIDPSLLLAGDGIASRLTLWGDGRLALRRVDRAALAALAGNRLSDAQVRQILEARDAQQPGTPISIDAWLAGAELTQEDREALMALVTEESSCYSVTVSSQTPWRTHYLLAILEREPPRPENGGDQIENKQLKERVLRFAW